jgi:hypothetical protein
MPFSLRMRARSLRCAASVSGWRALARESGQQGWWDAYGDVPQRVYIALETDAASLHTYEPIVIPGLVQTPAYAQAVIGETKQATCERAGESAVQ